MFVTAQDFNRPPYNVSVEDMENGFDAYIEDKEKEVLIKLLGRSLYYAFVAGLEQLTPDERWLKLRDGSSYVFSNRTYYYDGIKTVLVPYIASQWYNDNIDSATATGIVIAEHENSSTRESIHRIVKLHNEYYEKAGNLDFCYYDDERTYNTLLAFVFFSGSMYEDSIGTYGSIQGYLSTVSDTPEPRNIFNL